MVPEISVDALVEIWETIDQDHNSDQDSDSKVDQDSPNPTCKHEVRKGKKANTQCKTKVKGIND